ncbi:MAG: hypothetical protein K2X35_07265 [Bryobacteraceae bacterium]|nr:hypothetical protein [Bryobacteraceae bacterium]
MKHPAKRESSTLLPPAAPGASIDTATIELLESWKAQDATCDPEELRLAEQEVLEFQKAINENRTASGERILVP